MGRVFVGCAGWSYPHWNGLIYPKPRPRGFEPLAWLAERLDCVEVNPSFYRPLDRRTVERWISLVESNPDFQFTVKLGRQFTHDRLLAPSAIAFFKEGLWSLVRAKRLGGLLMQFPPEFCFNRENRDLFLNLRRAFHEFPLAAEMRHESWTASEAVGTLIDHRVAAAHGESLTSGLGYFRIRDEAPDVAALAGRVERLAPFTDQFFVVFKHDPQGVSFRLAEEFGARLGGRTFEPAQASLDFARPLSSRSCGKRHGSTSLASRFLRLRRSSARRSFTYSLSWSSGFSGNES